MINREIAWSIAFFISLLLLWKGLGPLSAFLTGSIGLDGGMAIVIAFSVLLLGPIFAMRYIRRNL